MVVELPGRRRGQVMLDSAGGVGASTVVVVAMHGETSVGSPNVGEFMTEWMAGSKKIVPQDRDSK